MIASIPIWQYIYIFFEVVYLILRYGGRGARERIDQDLIEVRRKAFQLGIKLK